MTVKSHDGRVDVVEQTLEEYALIITGRAQPQEFSGDQYQILELRQKLEMAAVEIRWQERYIKPLETDKAKTAVQKMIPSAAFARSPRVGTLASWLAMNSRLLSIRAKSVLACSTCRNVRMC